MHKPRIAILGFAIECNRFAPVATGADFRARVYLEGERLLERCARRRRPRRPRSPPSCEGWMRFATGRRCPSCLPTPSRADPSITSFFCETLAEFRRRLQQALPLDAVYICEHGAAITTAEDDPDGLVFQTVREIVGGSVPVVATIDLHANVSDRMVDLVDLLISYRRNPHTDMAERGAEAADALHELIEGMQLRWPTSACRSSRRRRNCSPHRVADRMRR